MASNIFQFWLNLVEVKFLGSFQKSISRFFRRSRAWRIHLPSGSSSSVGSRTTPDLWRIFIPLSSGSTCASSDSFKARQWMEWKSSGFWLVQVQSAPWSNCSFVFAVWAAEVQCDKGPLYFLFQFPGKYYLTDFGLFLPLSDNKLSMLLGNAEEKGSITSRYEWLLSTVKATLPEWCTWTEQVGNPPACPEWRSDMMKLHRLPPLQHVCQQEDCD